MTITKKKATTKKPPTLEKALDQLVAAIANTPEPGRAVAEQIHTTLRNGTRRDVGRFFATRYGVTSQG